MWTKQKLHKFMLEVTQRKMSSDLEIIEDVQHVIEISDDSRDEVVINYLEEEKYEDNKEDVCIIVKEEHGEILIPAGEVTNNSSPGRINKSAKELATNINTGNSSRKNKRRKRNRLARKLRAMNRSANASCGNGQFNKVLRSENSPELIRSIILNTGMIETYNICEVSNNNEQLNPEEKIIDLTNLAEPNTDLNNKVNVTCENVSNIEEPNTDLNNKVNDTCENDQNESNTEELVIETQLNTEESAIELRNLQQSNEDSNNQVKNICKKPNQDYSKLRWLKPLNSLSSPAHLQIVIIDRSHQDWRITNDKWFMIEKRLLETLNHEMLRTNDTSIGLFDGAKWQRGIKIIGCHNENALNFITKFIFSLDKLWHGAKLDVFPITQINRHIVKGFIPAPVLKTELMLSLIKLQNPRLCCEDWKVVRERERANNEGIDIWISVNDESFTRISRLRGEIKYGINRIFLNPSYNY